MQAPRPWNRRPAAGGLVVALVGVDGSGKSTLLSALTHWLGAKVDVLPVYFGTGDEPFALLAPFDDWYSQVKPAGYYLYELPLHSAPATRVDVRDTKTGELRRDLINFASYNYLGLSYRPEVKQAIREAAEIYGGGSSGSPILSGTTALHRAFTEEMAADGRAVKRTAGGTGDRPGININWRFAGDGVQRRQR